MLAEGQRRHSRGGDVVIALVEAHGRQATAAMAEGLEAIPRRVLSYRGTGFTEMDLDAVLARHPQVALVDELAHTNMPGCRNGKRWQDVDELLDAGIDVVTTLNIQHLESLNDVVGQITGTQQHETLPDEVARRADQVELVDMTTEALRRRMVHGSIYPADRIEAALSHYFRPGNLTALRELALLWVADRVEEGLQRYRVAHGIAAPWETRERILVAITGASGEEAVIRRAARIAAQTPGSDLLAVHVTREDGLAVHPSDALAAHRDLAVSLGAGYRQVTGDSVADTLLHVAYAENVTQMVIGASRRGRLATLLAGEGIGRAITHRSGPIDVHYVSREAAEHRRYLRDMAGSLAGTPPRAARYVLIILAAFGAALLAADYMLPTPRSPGLARSIDALILALVVLVAIAAGLAFERAARWAARAEQATVEATVLTRLAACMVHGRCEPALLEEIRQIFGLAAVSLLERQHGAGEQRWSVLASTGERPPEHPGADLEVPVSDSLTLAGRGRKLTAEDERVLQACAVKMAAALTRRRADQPDPRPKEDAADRRSRSTMLAATSRDARGQLAAADQALARLADPQATQTSAERAALVGTGRRAVRRLGRLLDDLRELGRLHAGALETYLRPVDLDDVLAACLDELGPGGHHLTLRLPDLLPDVIADADLLSRLLTSLMADALHRSPPDLPPALTAVILPEHVEIRVADQGSAEPPDGGANLAVRLALDLTEAMSGTLRSEETAGGGRTVVITLPSAAPRPPVSPQGQSAGAAAARPGRELAGTYAAPTPPGLRGNWTSAGHAAAPGGASAEPGSRVLGQAAWAGSRETL